MAGTDPFPKTLAFLQNQWFHKPDVMRRLLDRQFNGDREDFNHTYLFHVGMKGMCKTGRVLTDVFGEKLCDSIIWQEASPVICGESRACPPADHDHIVECITRHKPTIVMGFGKIACDALEFHESAFPREQGHTFKLIKGPHPAGRDNNAVRIGLTQMMLALLHELKVIAAA